jgi:hypothetical protein
MILKRERVPIYILISLSAVFFTGCAVNYKTIADAQVVPIKNQEMRFDMVAAALTGQGFDLRLADKDIGIIITEYKKYGQAESKGPFDYYLQIVVRFAQRDGQSVIILEPKEKQVDQSNSAASTDIHTVFFDDREDKNGHKLYFVARKPGFLLFTNVLKAIAAEFGTSMDQIKFDTVDRKQIIVKSDDTLK